MTDSDKKPIILSIESSGNTSGIALHEGTELLAEYSLVGKNLHDKLMTESIRRLLGDLELKIEDISAIAVSAGPGSFTGLRIGAAIAKGLCFEGSPKFIAVPNLSAFAFAARDFAKALNASGIIATIKAHKNLMYRQEFNIEAEASGEIIMTDTTEFEALDTTGKVLCGTAAEPTAFTLKTLTELSPRIIGEYAVAAYNKSDFADAAEFTPMYIQEFEIKTSKKKIFGEK
ncbi:MAG: tRNA (adenosine(37)-N6)-threonylcarbamoyltransferase complex dimerization subunit type 1 TsaB [Candidatus Kapabacteria bacterium]|nr:tRNA (adenosine(37)-N6)-threonylcarbamoyltransferase complex dimerization subunit type 1 TsaB [Candidatus Kapabacteria bacterium]